MTSTLRVIIVVVFIALHASVPSSAQLKSFRGPLVQERIAPLTVSHDGIRVTSYQFLRSLRHVEKIFKADAPAIRFALINEATEARDVALAVALFDASGNLVGVASEAQKLKPGESRDLDLTFRSLNRYAPEATTLQLSIETRL